MNRKGLNSFLRKSLKAIGPIGAVAIFVMYSVENNQQVQKSKKDSSKLDEKEMQYHFTSKEGVEEPKIRNKKERNLRRPSSYSYTNEGLGSIASEPQKNYPPSRAFETFKEDEQIASMDDTLGGIDPAPVSGSDLPSNDVRRARGGGAGYLNKGQVASTAKDESGRQLGSVSGSQKEIESKKEPPRIISISSLSGDGEFGLNKIVEIEVVFDGPVYTAGIELALLGGGKAIYKSGSGSSKIVFEYLVQAGEEASDLDVIEVLTNDAKDSKGNKASSEIPAESSLAVVNDIVIDTTPATISIDTYPTINIANEASYTFGGTCSENSQNVDYNIGGLTGAVSCTSLSWSVTLDVSSLSDSASVAITADHADLAGNSATQASQSVLKDTVRPSPLSLATPASGSYLASASQTLTGTCESGASLSIAGDLASGASGTCASGSYSIAITLSSGDGVKNFTIDQTDAAGNSMATPLAASYTLDTDAPSIISISSTSPGDGTYGAGQIIDIIVTFDQNVNTGSSSLTLDTGATASYLSGTGASSIVYRYTVAASDTSSDLNVSSFNVGDAKDAALNPAGPTLPASNNLADNQAIVISQSQPFISRWRVLGGGETITLPLRAGFNYNFSVDWGDGSPSSTITSSTDPDRVHSYSAPGDYTVTITGLVEAWYFNNSGDKDKVLEVNNLGDMGWINLEGAFAGCSNLDVFEGGVVDNVTTMASMFEFATNVAPNTSLWNVSNVTNMSRLFKDADKANPDTSSWDVSNVTDMSYMFDSANVANPNTSSWVVSNVTDMSHMFENAFVADPDVSSWNVSGVTSFSYMFHNADSASPNTSSWNTSSATDFSYMFEKMNGGKPVMTSWNFANVTTMQGMFTSEKIATASYSQMLIDAEAQSSQANVLLGAGCSKYNSAGAVARAALIADHSWSITDCGRIPYLTQLSASSTLNGSHSAGDVIDITASFSSPVTTSTSSLSLSNGATAVYLSGSGTSSIVYRYTVSLSDAESNDLDVTSFGVGDADDGAGNAPEVNMPTGNNLADNNNIAIDTTAPVVASVTSDEPDSTYPQGATLEIKVVFDSNIIVGGAPTLTLETGSVDRTASFLRVDNQNEAIFLYTVQGADSSSDLDYISSAAISLNGGSFTDSAGNNADTTLPVPGAVGSLSNNKELVIQTSPPMVAQVNTSSSDGYYKIGDSINIHVVFDRAVNVTGSPSIAVNSGASVNYSSGSGTNTLTFIYTVGPGENSGDFDYSNSNAISLSGGTIKGTYGNNADLTLATPGALNSISDDKALVVDGIVPTVAITSAPNITDGNKTSYTFGGTCSENGRNVDYTIGGETGSVACSSGSWSATHNTVNINDGPSILITADHTDVAGNAASQASITVDKTTTDTTPPVVAFTAPASGATVTAGTEIEFNFDITDNVAVDWSNLLATGMSTTNGSQYMFWKSIATGSSVQTMTVRMYDDEPSMTVAVRAQDTSGNVTTAYHTVNLVQKLKVTTPAFASTVTQSSFTISGDCDASKDNIVVSDGATGSGACSGGSFSIPVVLSDTTGGEKVLKFVQNDSGGKDIEYYVKYTYQPPLAFGNRIANGGGFACYLDLDGKAYCWGYNGSGRTGTGAELNSNVMIPTEVDMSATGQSNKFRDISAGGEYVCAIHGDTSEVYCWGDNRYGRLGDGTTIDHFAPATINMSGTGLLNTFDDISAGIINSCGVHTSGKVFCWGSDFNGALGNGAGGASVVPVEPDLSVAGVTNDFIEVNSFNRAVCGLHSNKRIYCWGEGDFGKGGRGSTPDSEVPVEIDMSAYTATPAFKALAKGASEDHMCAILDDGRAFCWGEGSDGRLGNASTADKLTPFLVDMAGTGLANDFISITLGWEYTCGVHSSGQGLCWGQGSRGQLGDNGTSYNRYPDFINMDHLTIANDFLEIAGSSNDDRNYYEQKGRYTTCAIHSSGQVLCVGEGNYGHLGSSDIIVSTDKFMKIDMSAHAESNDFIEVGTGGGHNCGLHTNGKIFCWGASGMGALGIGSVGYNDYYSPVEIDMGPSGLTNDFIDLQTGEYTNCALHSSNKVLCWGHNRYGQTGTGKTMSSGSTEYYPKEIDLSAYGMTNDFSSLTVNHENGCAIHRVSAEALCWGANSGGQIGDGTNADSNVPLKVDMSLVGSTNNFLDISIGRSHACGIHNTGQMYCWGSTNTEGRLGNGQTSYSNVNPPSLVDMSATGYANSFAQVEVGGTSSCGIHTSGGKAFCWGANNGGQLGNGNKTNQPYPVQVDMSGYGLSNSFIKFNVDYNRGCGIHSNGKLYCWGEEKSLEGSLGLGSIGDTNGLPVEVPMDHYPETNSFLDVSVFGTNNCAILNGGAGNNQLMCAGPNRPDAYSNGLLGVGESMMRMQMTPVTTTNF